MSRLQLRNKARMEPRRWFCSEPPPPSSEKKPSKNSEASKEKKTVAAVNSFIQRCMLTNSEVFPKVTEVHEKVGGSWHSLKDILSEMKSKMIPNSQDGTQIVAEASKEFIVKENNRDDGKLDGDNVENPYTSEVKDSKDLSFAKVSDSAWITEPKQIERTIEMSDVGNSQDGTQIVAEESKEDIVKEYNTDNRQLDENNAENPHTSVVDSEELALVKVSDSAWNPEQKQVERTIKMSEVENSHTTKVEGLSALGLVNISDKVELAEVKQVEESIEILDVEKFYEELMSSEDNLSAKSSDHLTSGIIIEEEKDMLSSFFEKTREKRKELNETKIDSSKHQEGSNSKDNRYISDKVELAEVKQVEESLEILDVEKSHELMGSEDNLSAKSSDHSTSGLIVEEEKDMLSSFFEKTREKQKELNETRIDSSKHREGSNSKDNRYISDKVQLAEVKRLEESIEILDVEKSHEELMGLEDNLSAKSLDHSTSGIIVEEEKVMLSSFFEKTRGKRKELNETKIDFSKHQEGSNSKNGYINVMSLADALKKSQNDSVGDKVINENRLQQDGSMDVKEESREAAENTDLKGMINRILQLSVVTPKFEPNPAVHSNNDNRFNREMKSQVNESNDKVKARKIEIQTQKDKRHKENSSNLVVTNDNNNKNKNKSGNWVSQLDKKEREVDENDKSNSDIAAFDYPQPEPSNAIPLPYQRPNIDAMPSEQMGSPKYMLLMKFLLKTANTYHIALAFGNCESISEIRIVNSGRQNRFNYAYICFKTAEGMKEALSKDDITVCGKDVTLEEISSSNAENKIDSADSVTDSNFPQALLKSPSRTIMVKGLTEDLPFHYLTYVFSNWGHVSNIVMGSSPSIAYVEFKSEDAKERVLAEGVVYINGKKLAVLRVDSSKTTVVRVSNVNPDSKLEKIHSICDSNGQVKRIVKRDAGIFDVYFSSSEWTNMVQILNRLNGQLVDQHQWIAQPATVIPAQVLQSMWNTPAGRKHVHGMYQNICTKIAANSIDIAPVLRLAKEYYGDS